MNHVLILFLIISTSFCCKFQKLWNPLIYNKNSQHVAALILARGGSKGIPLKNLSKIGGRTLINITLTEILKVDFSSVWLSTDHEKISKEAKSVNVHWRSQKSATDEAPSILGVQDFLEKHPEVDIVALVQCTSPFIRSWYLQKGLNSVFVGEKCVFSATRSYNLRWVEEVEGRATPVNFDLKNRPRRQDWRGELVENGMFYFVERRLAMRGFLQSDRLVELTAMLTKVYSFC